MSAFRWHCIKVMPDGSILRAGVSCESWAEAHAIAEQKIEKEPDQEGEIMVVDDLELAALAVGKRYAGDGDL